MERIYYTVRYRLDNKDRYLIWFRTEEEDLDGVVVGKNGTIPIFINETDLMNYAESCGFMPVESSASVIHNLDAIAKWLNEKKRQRARRVDCEKFLNDWNLLGDVSSSIGGDFDPQKERTQKIYEKLFWGNNLPSLTPPGKFYVPIWSGREMQTLHEVFSQGLLMFRSHTKLMTKL